MTLKGLQGKEHKSKPGESMPFLVRFNGHGGIDKIEPIAAVKSVYITNVVKVNDKSINLLGLDGNFDSTAGKTLSSGDNLVHIMADRLGRVICSNLQN